MARIEVFRFAGSSPAPLTFRFPGRLVGVGANIKYVYQIAAGHIFLVEAKRRLDMRLWQFVPEAVTQAMSIASNAK